ncbi:Laminin EGF domain, partial [Trinorchestia longiramus]
VEELFEVHKVRSASQQHLLTVLPRFGHSMLSDNRGVLWLFGGYSLSRGPLNDVVQFDSKTNAWVEVTVTVQPGKQPPPHRYFHSAAYVPSKRSMFIYGGLSKHRYLGDLWSFSVDSEGWTLLDRPVVTSSGRSNDGSMDFLLPPPVAGHTLTYCNDGEKEVLILIGGVSDVYGFLDVVWEYRVSTGAWSVLETSGTAPLGVFGHSTVYHAKDRVFYVYGGYTYNVDKVSLLGELYAFHYPTKVWSLLPPDKKINSNPSSRPSPRAFHTAVASSDYLLIIGGYVEEQRDSHQTLIVYSYECNMWIPLNQYLITLVGPQLPPLLGLAAAAYEDTAYIYGGYDGVTQGGMMSIRVPLDLCTLNANETQCRDRIGCANCVVFNDLGNNSSHCYSNDRNTMQPKECFGHSGGMVPGKVCDASLLQKDCYQYTSCAACVAQYPAVPGSKPKCKWCRHCNKTKCIPRDNNCVTENTCEKGSNKADINDTKVIEDADQCPEKSCAASDCTKCKDLKHCIWTRQVMRSHATFTLNFKPVYDWNCVDNSILNHSSFVVQATPPQSCPARCHTYSSCNDCLKSYGSEGGWQGCYWSENLRSCMSPSYAPIGCLGGRCGLLLQEPPCPLPCSMHSTCSSCLEHPHCGWCALNTSVGGLGMCREGGLESPHSRECKDLNYNHFLRNTSVVTLHGLSPAGPLPAASWHYLKCPAEDECRSGHHDCHPRTQECVDEVDGFSCRCAAGYNTSLDGSCVPLCEQGCLHGTCIEPNNCLCNFGYVGFNCSIKCKCNSHSDCRGPDRLTECVKCHNNTEGDQCERCMDFFVGDPTKDEACVSCFVYCNHHTNECYPVAEGSTLRSSAITNLEDLPARSGVYANTVCSNCANNTAGATCGSCMPGFFRGSSDGKDGCKPCECNGHSQLCDPVWGDDCACANNTVSPCSGKSNNRGLPSKDEDKD